MSESKADRETLAELLAEVAQLSSGEHLELEMLARYREGSLDTEGERRAQDHLVCCRHCAAKLLELEGLSDPDPGLPAEAADFEVAAAWRDLQRRGGIGVESPGPRGGHWWVAVAVALALAAVGLSLSTLHFRREARASQDFDARAPQVNPIIVYLDAVTRSDPQGSSLLEVESGADLVVVLAPETQRKFEDYGVLIVSSDGREIWRSRGLRLSDYGTLRLGVPGSFLAPGDYSLRFDGADGSRQMPLGDYELRVHATD